MSSEIKGKVGKWDLTWLSAPRGPAGSAFATLGTGEKVEVRWRKDADGIWIELPDGVYGFDIQAELNDNGTLHYHLSQRGTDRFWAAQSFLRSGEEQALAGAAGKKSGMRIRAQMPGKIVRVLAQLDQMVEKDQPLVVMEAMKMENEIRAPNAGKVKLVKVTEGQAVESGADLIILE